MHAKITGLGHALPDHIVTNHDLAQVYDTSDEWITQRTGISQRRHSETETTGDLATRAAREALRMSGRESVSAVVLATATPDYRCPGTAPSVAAKLGLEDVPAFDVSAVCSGFVYALSVGASLVETGRFESVLVIGAETFSTILDPADRTTGAIFGDGAGALLLERSLTREPGTIGSATLGSNGNQADLIQIPGGGSAAAIAGADASPYFQMQGAAVFLDAVTRMEAAVRDVVDAEGWHLEDIDALVPHQANVRIINALAKQLDLPPEKAVVNIADLGNTSAASIPLALAQGSAAGRFQAGDRLILAAYGGGTTWGAIALTWPNFTSTTTAPSN
ncbi:beta-ketoacyl-ACP synthase III [Pseudoclavibacter sp. VKM Ac-2888]|uniref:beta-ketoacyl-ACP synthase III n=1 Tax=Pseudoclavibacter sp. VKM Ac-2888 TaxID=2783830 RepID=UPI001E46F01F|nr:beta-ketoacyl-ACP synthase III [Pseudoclavibacter sp. VKM Ac-2888]